MTLTDRDRQMLAFEKRTYRFAGAREQAITDEFEMTPTRYHQLLNVLIDNPAALEADPVLINRLRRLRQQRRHRRSA